jgi:hypothetical protein
MHLTKREDVHASSEVRLKVATDVLHGVDAHAVDSVLRGCVRDPLIELRHDRSVLRVDVGQRELPVARPALLDVRLVGIVCDEALRV